jgi:hypothetical protein
MNIYDANSFCLWRISRVDSSQDVFFYAQVAICFMAMDALESLA